MNIHMVVSTWFTMVIRAVLLGEASDSKSEVHCSNQCGPVFGRLAHLARASVLHAEGSKFNSCIAHLVGGLSIGSP